MDEIGDEFNDKPENDGPIEEPSELTNESEELNEADDDLPEIFGENDELDDDLPEIFGEAAEIDDDLPEIFDETGEIDDDLPEIFGETSEGNDILNNAIHDKEDGELSDEDQDSGDAGNIYENIGSESTTTVLTSEAKEIEEMECPMESQEQEEETEIPPEEYQGDSEPIVNTEEIEFINKIEELAEFARKTKGEDEVLEPQAGENAAYHAEKYYENLKEKEVVNEQYSKEEQEIEEVRQEMTEESENLEEMNETSKEITSTEEFEYLWNVREGLDREGKSDEEITEVMQEAEEIYKTLKEAEKLFEEQQQEKLKQVNREDEANVEDLKEDLDRVDLIEQAVELEQILVQQERSQEEIDLRVEEAIEETIQTSEFGETIEKLYEEQEIKKSKLADLEEEESIGILKEDLDRVDLIEQAVEIEENLAQQERSQEEIDMKVEEAIEETIETSEFGETLEKLYEEQEIKKLKLADLEEEESIGILKEDLDRVDLIEQAVEIEENLAQQERSQEEIDMKVEEAIERTELEKNYRLGKSQEEIDKQMEEVASTYQKEINNIREKEEELVVNEKIEKDNLEIKEQNSIAEERDQIGQTSTLQNEKKAETYEIDKKKEKLEPFKPELETIESESEEKKEIIEESPNVAKEKSKEEEDEHLQELYHQETGKRPIYAKERTKGYIQWLEQRELESEKIQKSQHEREAKEEIEEEGWKTTLKRWIRGASEDECNSELKSELEKALERYKEFEDLTKILMKLYEKSQHENLSEKEKNTIKSLIEKLQQFGPVQLELLANIRAIKKYINEHGWELMNRFHENRVHSRFFEHISQKILKLKEIINNEEIRKQLDLSKNFDSNYFKNNLCSLDLVDLYEKYHNETKFNANSGLKFTQRFKKYIKDHKTLSNFEKYELKRKIDLIEKDNNLEKYILYFLANTTYKIDKIINKIKDIKGLTTSYKTVKELEKKYNLEVRETYRDSRIHPNLNKDYFNVIDSKEKAYFLGFLYADGWIVVQKDGIKTMGININPKDESIIDYFIDCVNANISKKAYYTDSRGLDIVHIDISDQRFCNTLIKQGIIPKKSNVIEYPKFDNRKISLSFLLGFFDGDGTQGTTRITCGSKKFLEQIKEKYNLPYKLDKDKRKKNCYFLHLGAELFNEMLDNFKNSLQRKRLRLCNNEDRLERSKKGSSTKKNSGILANVKKEVFEELVWKMPFIEIGKLFGCSGRAISKKCDNFGIKKPPFGYWKKKEN